MKYLIGLMAIVFLSGCATWTDYRYKRGLKDGEKYSRNGYKQKNSYYKGFRTGFLIQNFNNVNEEYQ